MRKGCRMLVTHGERLEGPFVLSHSTYFMRRRIGFHTAGVKQRHWEEINRITGLGIERTELTSMSDIASFHLENYTEAIEETCVAAVKEYGLEKALNAMETVGHVYRQPWPQSHPQPRHELHLHTCSQPRIVCNLALQTCHPRINIKLARNRNGMASNLRAKRGRTQAPTSLRKSTKFSSSWTTRS